MSDKPTTSLEKVIQTAIDSALKEVHTCLPAIVTRVDYPNQLIDAQITIQRKLAGVLVNLPLLVNVPIRYMKSSTFSITFPIEINDNVMVLIAERSIDTWLTEGGIKDPVDIRKFDLSDAFAIPMMYHQKDVIPSFSTTNLEIKTNSGQTRIILKKTEGVQIVTTGDIDMVSIGGDIDIDSIGGNIELDTDGAAHVKAGGNVDVESTGANVNVTASGVATVEAPSVKLGAAAAVGVVRVGDQTGISGGTLHTHNLPNGSTKVLTE